jgi:hypothetical protein
VYYRFYFSNLFHLLVEELGIKDLLPPYTDPNLQPQDLLTGVCFASGGAGYDPLTPQIVVRKDMYLSLSLSL